MPSLRGESKKSRPSAGVIAAIVIGAAAAAGGAVYVATRNDSSSQDRTHVATSSDSADRRVGSSGATEAPGAPDTRATDTKSTDTKATDTKATDTKPTDTKPTDTKPTDTKPTDTKPTDTKATDGKSIDSKTGARPPGRPDAPTGKTRPGAQGGRPAGPDDDLEGDEEVRQKLKQATAAVDRRDYDQAERIANSVINAPASPKQHATARLIHGTVQCAARNDQEAAGIDLRGLEGFRALKARLLAVCRRHGIFTAQ